MRASSSKKEIESVLRLLAATPREVTRLARGCNEQQLHRKPDADAWSAQEIVAHLRACADVWGGSIDRMLAEDHPTIRYVSPRGWIRKTDFLQQNFKDSLRAFADCRASLVKTLTGLRASDWTRRATFTGTTLGRDARRGWVEQCPLRTLR